MNMIPRAAEVGIVLGRQQKHEIIITVIIINLVHMMAIIIAPSFIKVIVIT